VEIRHIKELMAAMGRTHTKRLTFKKDGVELQLEREIDGRVEQSLELIDDLPGNEPMRRATAALSKAKESASSLSGSPTVPSLDKEEVASVYVTSPMVGTFYSSSSPDAPPFIKEGDKIDKNTVVCIIEAMKVMNEIKAGVNGTVVELMVESGSPVEFGSKLFRVT
jgi:acetyl-CoA carboxylase biotin carboxyl carrier protein